MQRGGGRKGRRSPPLPIDPDSPSTLASILAIVCPPPALEHVVTGMSDVWGPLLPVGVLTYTAPVSSGAELFGSSSHACPQPLPSPILLSSEAAHSKEVPRPVPLALPGPPLGAKEGNPLHHPWAGKSLGREVH